MPPNQRDQNLPIAQIGQPFMVVSPKHRLIGQERNPSPMLAVGKFLPQFRDDLGIHTEIFGKRSEIQIIQQTKKILKTFALQSCKMIRSRAIPTSPPEKRDQKRPEISHITGRSFFISDPFLDLDPK